ncbi:MAG TPA: 16S rRNA (guanine(527)-N(7))-methyltransferase RsmG [Acidobacteriota bacterium]|nr:16S rRNA (guanine(527)-N(7))-methyltransferase RsmG [Acidobacteriota bacterium]
MKLSADLIAKLIGEEAVDVTALSAAEQYCDLIAEANRKINLVSRAGDVATEIARQFALSVAVIPKLPDTGPLHWLDIGSGGGFPAIPIAIFRPRDSFDLIESVAKKAFFLERASERLGLVNLRVINQRAEEFLRKPISDTSRYNILSLKAVAGWKEAFAWANSALAPGGTLITFKPPESDPGELQAVPKQSFELIETFCITGLVPGVTTRIMMFRKPA